MERPTWATTVATIGLILGCLGVLGSAQTAFMPDMIDMQRDMLDAIAEADRGSESGGSASGDALSRDFIEGFAEQLEVPVWFETSSRINGLVGVVLSAGCVFASILLLVMRPNAVILFAVVSAGSLIWHVVRGAVALEAGGFFAGSAIGGAALGFVVHAGLLLTLGCSDRSAYSASTP